MYAPTRQLVALSSERHVAPAAITVKLSAGCKVNTCYCSFSYFKYEMYHCNVIWVKENAENLLRVSSTTKVTLFRKSNQQILSYPSCCALPFI